MIDDMKKSLPMYNPEVDKIDVEREKLMEDQVFNSFVDENIGIKIGELAEVSNTKYIQGNQESRDAYNVLAYQIVSTEFEKAIKNNPRMENMGFQRYAKLWNPTTEYIHTLRNNNRIEETDPAMIFDNIFGQDPGLMKTAALEGFKIHLENTME
tara:strand:+ start:1332 stop:1793 length:462 start_codon:yes stop_codon:yes gene_type:complete